MFHYLQLVTSFLVFLKFVPSNAAEWSSWNHWSLCFEHSSGISAQIRTRACVGGSANKCQGSDTQARACHPSKSLKKWDETSTPETKPLTSIAQANAEWTLWSEWTECQSHPSGYSKPFKTRWRICDRRKCEMVEAIGGTTKIKCISCRGAPVEQKYCAEPSTEKKHCQWDQWSAWSPCSTTCGSGTRVRVRSCPCQKCSPEEASHEEETCYNLLPCLSNQPLFSTVALPTVASFYDASKTQSIFDPCSACAPNYPLPCYTCLIGSGNL